MRDGLRILVERLWPRGVSKENAPVDLWLKEPAPSTELRKWFDHDREKWGKFRKRYWSELGQKGNLLVHLKHRTIEGTVTFVYAAPDEGHNSALALKRISGRTNVVWRGLADRSSGFIQADQPLGWCDQATEFRQNRWCMKSRSRHAYVSDFPPQQQSMPNS